MSGIEVQSVTKKYKNVTALDKVSFRLAPGKIYGLLGRNGAGKSTLIDIIANRIFADDGRVLIDGIHACENMQVHEKIFCMSEADLYDKDLKVKTHFKWVSEFYDSFDLEKALEISEKFGLDVDKRFKALSKGFQSIFKLTVALSLNVPYVIFDEPVLGLDANHRAMFYDLLLKNFEETEQTIIIATHLIEEISNLIEEIILIDRGKILMHESVEKLLEMGYCVSGSAAEVERYCDGKNVIGDDSLGGLKVAYILGERTEDDFKGNVEFSAMNLQKLFVKLTKDRGED